MLGNKHRKIAFIRFPKRRAAVSQFRQRRLNEVQGRRGILDGENSGLLVLRWLAESEQLVTEKGTALEERFLDELPGNFDRRGAEVRTGDLVGDFANCNP